MLLHGDSRRPRSRARALCGLAGITCAKRRRALLLLRPAAAAFHQQIRAATAEKISDKKKAARQAISFAHQSKACPAWKGPGVGMTDAEGPGQGLGATRPIIDERYQERLRTPTRRSRQLKQAHVSGSSSSLAAGPSLKGSRGRLFTPPRGRAHKVPRHTLSGTPERRRRARSSRLGSGSRSRAQSSDSLALSARSSTSTGGGSGALYSDRFIPSRSGSNLENAFEVVDAKVKARTQALDSQGSSYSALLKKEILAPKDPVTDVRFASSPIRTFRFKTPVKKTPQSSPFSMSPVCSDSLGLQYTPRKPPRKIAKSPFKVLDAPSLKDDFYLNLVDWSGLNVLAVGLGPCTYLWSAFTSKVTKLCDLSNEGDSISSVAWSSRGTHLAVGTRGAVGTRTGARSAPKVQVWDAVKCKPVRTMECHRLRVGTLAWNSQLLASGSRDHSINLLDIRARDPVVRKLEGHGQEVCGLKWSLDERQLASGGNDNKLFIWNAMSSRPVLRLNEHAAAVKAIAWSPHQHGLLASGGGTADRCIRFWNTLTGTALNHVDTGSQVCNLAWSKNVNEIVSTHGYSLNQVIVWKYPSMQKLATLTGHTYRVLYLAVSPDGETIVTGAGDETLRFWNVFPSSKTKSSSQLGSRLYFPSAAHIR